jgi:hypothetical protein
MWINYYLQAPTQSEFEAALPETFNGALDVIGELGGGYCANLRLPAGVDVPQSLLPYLIDKPAFPQRVWL